MRGEGRDGGNETLRGRDGEDERGGGDLSSGARALFWQLALTDRSALKSTSLSINLPNHVSR